MTNYDLKEKANINASEDYAFIVVCRYEKYHVVNFLLSEMNIEKTNYIKDFLLENPSEQIEHWFEMRI